MSEAVERKVQLVSNERVAQVISSQDRKCVTEQYKGWAETYEKDMAAVSYSGPAKLLEYFNRLNVPKDAKILDVCAGTGAVGRLLVKLGYSNLHAFDGSEEMLAKAKQENNYKSYTQMLFEPGTKLPFEDNAFDCVLLSGVFAPGHLPIVALEETVRICKKGGVVSWICCDPLYYQDMDEQYKDNGFNRLIDSIKANGLWKEREGFPVSVPFIEYSDGYVMAFDVTKQD